MILYSLQIHASVLDKRKKREKLATIIGSMNATYEREFKTLLVIHVTFMNKIEIRAFG